MRVLSLALLAVANGFSPSGNSGKSRSSISISSLQASSNSIVVVSPPGGVGEVAAVEAACLGSSVRWFVVSDDSSSTVSLAPESLSQISEASGSLELAGASVDDLKSGGSSLAAVSKWCGNANGMVCTYDGSSPGEEFKAALRLAAQEAASCVSGAQVAVLGADEDLDDEEESSGSSGSSLIGSLFSNSPEIPPTLMDCLDNSVCVRHGELFGTPQSSPDFSPLVGGPKRDPVITEEFVMRDARVDPFVYSGNVMASSTLKASRHTVGKIAAFLANGDIESIAEPISISSQSGTEELTIADWKKEFDRVSDLLASGKASTLFSQELIVDDVGRLSEWLATKWAPAVLRTYDIAAIRIGARPVYSSNIGSGQVEIVWQELVDFQSVVTGRMLVQVSKNGIEATRGAGDPAKGFGEISKRPLPGEDVLVRQLGEASSQAVEKGLAKKVLSKPMPKTAPEAPAPVSSLESSGTVAPVSTAKASETGPRQAGARRSTPRSRRGTKKSPSSSP